VTGLLPVKTRRALVIAAALAGLLLSTAATCTPAAGQSGRGSNPLRSSEDYKYEQGYDPNNQNTNNQSGDDWSGASRDHDNRSDERYDEGYEDGYDNGYEDGYDQAGYDRNGYDRDGYDQTGYDRNGYDCDGYDRSGRDRNGQYRYDDNARDNEDA
jgi:hypothetical protein